MHRSDGVFRDSVKATVVSDDKYLARYEETMRGACRTGRCTENDRQRPTPTVQLFDGGHDITLFDTDGGVNFTIGKGRPSSIEIQSCEAENAPRECRENSSQVHVLTEPRLSRSTPVAPYYRFRFSEDGTEYLLQNTVSVRGTDLSQMKERCATTLCEVNSRDCPAPHCRRDGIGRCLPSKTHIHAVQLSDL